MSKRAEEQFTKSPGLGPENTKTIQKNFEDRHFQAIFVCSYILIYTHIWVSPQVFALFSKCTIEECKNGTEIPSCPVSVFSLLSFVSQVNLRACIHTCRALLHLTKHRSFLVLRSSSNWQNRHFVDMLFTHNYYIELQIIRYHCLFKHTFALYSHCWVFFAV